jgi:uncharacterized membrane protein YgcG
MSTLASGPSFPSSSSQGKVKPGAGQAPKKKNRKQALIAAAVALLLMGAGLSYFLLRSPAPNGKPAEVAKFVGSDAFDALPAAKQQEYFDAIEKNRDAYRALPEEQRRLVWEAAREARENQELDKFAKMNPDEQKKFVDERIKEEEARRKQWQDRATSRPAGQGGPGGGWGQGGPGGGGGQGGPGGRGGGPGGRGFSAERQKARLENQSPQRRATAALMRAMIAERRVQLGLPAQGGRGGGGGGGGRRGG